MENQIFDRSPDGIIVLKVISRTIDNAVKVAANVILLSSCKFPRFMPVRVVEFT